MTVTDGSSVGGVAKEGEVSVWLLHSGNHTLASSEEESMIDGSDVGPYQLASRWATAAIFS